MLATLLVWGRIRVFTLTHTLENLNYTSWCFSGQESRGILCYNLTQRIGQLSNTIWRGIFMDFLQLVNRHQHLHPETMQSDESDWKWNAYINMHVLGCHPRSLAKTLYQALELAVLWTDCSGHSRPPKYMQHCVWSSDASCKWPCFLVYTAPWWWRDGHWINFSHACCRYDWTVWVTGLQ